jgi:LAS superfamily LD-carboxypeptidase LdcB
MPDDDFGFAPPPFNAEQALQQLQRALRDLKLSARGHGFELRGKPVIELELDQGVIAARLARRLVTTPEWDRFSIKSAADQRKLVDEVKKRLARWADED